MRFRAGLRDFGAEAHKRFLGSLFPVGAAEALRSDGVPTNRFVVSSRLFLDRPKLPRHHRVARALEKLGELRGCVGAVFGFADPRLDLPPVGHGGAL